jgi:hypothetical protein
MIVDWVDSSSNIIMLKKFWKEGLSSATDTQEERTQHYHYLAR